MHTMQESNPPVTLRKNSATFKRRIFELIEQPGASVVAVAFEHGVNANLVFQWRRAKLERLRHHRVLAAVFLHHAYRTLANFGGKTI
jgi:transposase-like protein